MDSKDLGNDCCVAWPTAEIAVMGAPGAVQILHRRELAGDRRCRARSPSSSRSRPSTRSGSPNPYVAAERGYVDDVIAAIRHPAGPRRRAARAARTKRERTPPSLQHAALNHDHSRSRHGSDVPDRTGRPPCCRASESSSPACSTTRRSRSRSRGIAQEQGAEVVLTSFGRVMRITERTAGAADSRRADRGARRHERGRPRRRSPARSAASSTAWSTRSRFAPESCLGGGFLDAPWEDVVGRAAGVGVLAEGARPWRRSR